MDKKIHFGGLDGLRFISISFVVLHHLFTFRNYYSASKFELPFIGLIGYYGIQFFFAGSGFLITYLLLKEHEKNGRISIRHFYMRRILRIWPAYYVLIFLALVVVLTLPYFHIPQITDAYLAADYRKANLLYFSFLPHIAGNLFPTAPYIHQTYTIGIEEQFYFIWGIIFLVAAKYARWLFWLILLAIPVCSILLNFSGDTPATGWMQKILGYLHYFRFSTFAIGSLWAYAFFTRQAWINVFKRVSVQLFIYLALILSIVFDISVPFFRDEYISILTLCVFSCATFTKESLIGYDANWLVLLGKISYGIYLFHIFAIVFAIKLCQYFIGDTGAWWQLSILVVLTMGLAILFGWLSYFTVEKFFLLIKKRLQKV